MDEIIVNLLESKCGISIGQYKISVLVYCHDVLLISTSLSHLQHMLNICMEFGQKWKIKYNPRKSELMNAGLKLFEDVDIQVLMYGISLPLVTQLVYLGMTLRQDNEYAQDCIDQFNSVIRSYFSLHAIGTKATGFKPFTKSHIYNSFCLPKMTYGLGLRTISTKTINWIERAQNNLIRSTLGISKFCHTSQIKEELRIWNFRHIHLKFKLITLKLAKRHPITNEILLVQLKDNTPTQYSFLGDLKSTLEKYAPSSFDNSSEFVFSNVNVLLKTLKNSLEARSTSLLKTEVRNLLRNFTSTSRHELNRILMSFDIIPRYNDASNNNTTR